MQLYVCIDPYNEEVGKVCIIEGELNKPGDNDVFVKYSDGSTLYTKARRFIGSHTRLSVSNDGLANEVLKMLHIWASENLSEDDDGYSALIELIEG